MARDLEITSTYRLVGGLFLRLLAAVYLIAFASIGLQIDALAGPNGILPYGAYLENRLAEEGTWAYWAAPGLFWLSAESWALEGAAILGCVFALLLMAGIWPRASAAAAFLLYLSIVGAGSLFMNFQWDHLLLEMGFLAIFLPGGSRTVVFLYRWLLFRLRFLSGLFKLVSGDPSWAGLTALLYYFETQPLPHAGSWYAHHLPDWILIAGTALVFALELVVPFLIFLPRRWRLIAAWATIGFQVAVILTSNHTFFNLLTLVLCLFLFDDKALSRVVPEKARGWLTRHVTERPEGTSLPVLTVAGALVIASLMIPVQIVNREVFPETVNRTLDLVKRYHLVHAYHVFPTMSRERFELIIEGSYDAVHWKTYEFRFKPGDPAERPRISQPHHPRLDWLTWFVPLGRMDMHQFWIEGLVRALFEGSKPVGNLFAHNPFSETPPNFLRFSYYRYRFTTPEERAESGHWWVRSYLRPMTPFPWFVRR